MQQHSVMDSNQQAAPAHARPTSPKEWDDAYPGLLDGLTLISGTANVIMQMSLPAVGRGVLESRVESGRLFDHPLKRARTTITFFAVAMFGTDEDRKAYRNAINGVHRRVYSTEESPVEYHAMNPQLQLWVAMCLAWGSVDTWQRIRGIKVDRATLAQLYQDLAPLATTLQVKPDMWPKDIAAFEAAWEKGIASATVDPEVKAFMIRLARAEFLGPFFGKLFGRFMMYRTIGFLPAPIRELLGWHWTDQEQEKFDKRMARAGQLFALLPLSIRTFLGPYMLRDLRRRQRKGQALI